MLAYADERPRAACRAARTLLEAARQERPTQSVVVLRPRRALRLTAIAAAAAVAPRSGSASGRDLSLQLARRGAQRALAESARAAASSRTTSRPRISLGEHGQVVRGPTATRSSSSATCRRPRTGKTYEAWVIGTGGPLKAGLFDGGEQAIVLLERAARRRRDCRRHARARRRLRSSRRATSSSGASAA